MGNEQIVYYSADAWIAGVGPFAVNVSAFRVIQNTSKNIALRQLGHKIAGTKEEEWDVDHVPSLADICRPLLSISSPLESLTGFESLARWGWEVRVSHVSNARNETPIWSVLPACLITTPTTHYNSPCSPISGQGQHGTAMHVVLYSSLSSLETSPDGWY